MSKSSKTEDPNTTSNPTDEASQPNVSCSAVCTITSQTVATQPTNRVRTRIGAGEEVDLTVNPGPATWTATPNDVIELPTNAGTTASNLIKIKALDKAGNVTITAKTSTCECSMTLTIVLPMTMTMERIPGTPLIHKQGHPSCGWYGRPIVTPSDVNFYNVSVRELDDLFNNTGIYAFYNGNYHGRYPAPDRASNWFLLSSYDSLKGSFITGAQDKISSGYNSIANSTNPSPPPPFLEGRAHTIIRWQWTINTSGTTHYNFPAFDQLAVSDGNGTCTQSKGGHSETSLVNDPTSG